MAETEGFEPSKQLPVYTLSKRAPSATRTSLLLKTHFNIIENTIFEELPPKIAPFSGAQKYSFAAYKPNIFSAFAEVIVATISTGQFFIAANFSTTYFK